MAEVGQGSSGQVAGSPATSTGANGGSAGSTIVSGSGAVSSPTPVVAAKGFRSALQQMLQGWQELIPSDSTLTSVAGSLTEAGVVAQLQAYLAPYVALDTNVTGAKQARAQADAALSDARKYYAALRAAVSNYFGPESPQLVKFGFKPRKARAPLTVQQLAVRSAKAAATRALRGTKGTVQKAKIKSGAMTYVAPVVSVAQELAPAATPVVEAPVAAAVAASAAPVEPVASAASPEAGK